MHIDTTSQPRTRSRGGVVARVAASCGFAAFVTTNLGWLLGGFAQPAAYSAVHDDISDLGAVTAASPWLYNQLSANVSGVLIVVFAIALWWALSPDLIGRIGAAVLVVGGAGIFLDGLFRLDCRGIDSGCHNDSWHAHAHKIESGITAAALLLSPVILAFAFRRVRGWRGAWLPSLAVVPLVIVANIAFSTWGDGAATRAGTVVLSGWLAFASIWFLRTIGRGGEEVPAS